MEPHQDTATVARRCKSHPRYNGLRVPGGYPKCPDCLEIWKAMQPYKALPDGYYWYCTSNSSGKIMDWHVIRVSTDHQHSRYVISGIYHYPLSQHWFKPDDQLVPLYAPELPPEQATSMPIPER